MRRRVHDANPSRWRRLVHGLLLCGVLTCIWPAARAEAQLCANTKVLFGAGYSDVLGMFAELGLRCPAAAGWGLAAGGRYTDQRATVEPFAVLSYDTPFAGGWSFGLVVSGRERAGDYEINRLPELYLRWNPPVGPSGLVPSVQVFLGSITTLRTPAQTTRAGSIFGLTTRPLRLGTMIELTPGIQYGNIAYGTGQTHSYWIGTVNLAVRPTPRTELGLFYLKQQGTGVSPLAFDQVSLDHLLTARIGQAVTTADWIWAAVTYTLVTPPASVKEYTFSWARAGAWTASVTFRQTDGRVFLGLALP